MVRGGDLKKKLYGALRQNYIILMYTTITQVFLPPLPPKLFVQTPISDSSSLVIDIVDGDVRDNDVPRLPAVEWEGGVESEGWIRSTGTRSEQDVFVHAP